MTTSIQIRAFIRVRQDIDLACSYLENHGAGTTDNEAWVNAADRALSRLRDAKHGLSEGGEIAFRLCAYDTITRERDVLRGLLLEILRAEESLPILTGPLSKACNNARAALAQAEGGAHEG